MQMERKMSLSMSPNKTQLQKISGEGGFIVDTFFGEITSFITYQDANEGKHVQTVKEHFAEILMNVIGIKDLYEAWENMY